MVNIFTQNYTIKKKTMTTMSCAGVGIQQC